jgi:[acyl-carrier-protein] S-malonyltransferase
VEAQMIAAVFPGQGSQRFGMGKDFHDQIKESRDVYQEASDSLGWDIAALCFGEDDRLNLTEFSQPCILTTEVAMLRGLKALYGFSPRLFGGHSLGEFTALVAAQCLSLANAVKIVHERGRLMQKAVPVGIGGMAAVISENLDISVVRTAISGLNLDIANINSANQVVISGEAAALPEAQTRLTDIFAERAFRFVALNVSAPFHSRYMAVIEKPFRETLDEFGGGMKSESAETVTSNFTGGFHENNVAGIQNNLIAQLSHTVQWRGNMEQLAARTDVVYEIGPGRPLREFFKTIGVACSSVTTFTAARSTFENK